MEKKPKVTWIFGGKSTFSLNGGLQRARQKDTRMV